MRITLNNFLKRYQVKDRDIKKKVIYSVFNKIKKTINSDEELKEIIFDRYFKFHIPTRKAQGFKKTTKNHYENNKMEKKEFLLRDKLLEKRVEINKKIRIINKRIRNNKQQTK
jgi:hypothetical protein